MTSDSSIEISKAFPASCRNLIDDERLALLDRMLGEFAVRRHELLQARVQRREQFASGAIPKLPRDFDAANSEPRIPPELGDRRVELQAQPSPEALLEALAAPASTVVMTLGNFIGRPGAALEAQNVVHDVLGGRSISASEAGVFIFGPRALEAMEPMLHWHDEAVPAALLDVLLYLHNNAAQLDAIGQGPYLHLAGVDDAQEAAFWSDILRWLEVAGIVEKDSIKVSIGIDTVVANFCAHEIINGLIDYATAVSSNRHTYLRSFIHTFQHQPQFVLPDRADLTSAEHFLRTQGLYLVRCAHQHGVHAIANCTASLPPEKEEGSHTMQWLRNEIERDARDGFDGCRVAEAALIPVARESFDRVMPGQHQLHRQRDDVFVGGADLLQVIKGKITEEGLRANIRLAVLGAASIIQPELANQLDPGDKTLASVELAADQLWQGLWLDTGVLDDGRIIDRPLFDTLLEDETGRLNMPPEPLQAAISRLSRHLQSRELPAHFLSE